ncbi:hypothetical protein K8374_07140 [Pseudomonas sp. p1(2021b)]|uniref:hypothetical protein n=1 Tax=Pseudomonas sp. p1(2021b) TaxID=2874628 RepID=UPI001CCA45D9|nr:hypothetical protein [Pseudomonas sp. p1(2021b)]UBM26733.1 hypothetical protein K8374_07140 [Pseudomonas sp. p1(2021b)]
MKEFYVVSAAEIDGVPLFFDEVWRPQLPEFNQVVENPELRIFCDSYELEIGLDAFDVDVIFEQYIASSKFVDFCKKYRCRFISIPLKVTLRGGMKPDGEYNLFLVLSRYSLLDIESSMYTLMDEGLLRQVDERENIIPVYDRIDKFVPRADVSDDLFYCEELKQIVCSSVFRAHCLEQNLAGLEFEKIDENFIYAPWG